MPAIATLGVHTQGLPLARQRLGILSAAYSGVYILATPVHPYRDSAAKLGNIVALLLEAQLGGREVIAGRMGALNVPLRALGISAADAGMGTGEAFSLQAKLRAEPSLEGSDEASPRGTSAVTRYLRPIKRSMTGKQVNALEHVPAAGALLRCRACCRFDAPDDRVRRGQEHSLLERRAEAQEISGLPTSMRLERGEREWEAAQRQLAAVNRALLDAGADPIAPDYLDNQLAVLRVAAAKTKAA